MDRSVPMLLVKLRASTREEYRVVTDKVIGFKYQDRERKADLAKLQVDNFDLSNFDDPVWRKGSTLIVQWGYPGRMTPAREVVITGVKGFKVLEVEAAAKSVVLNTVVKSRVWENRTISEVVAEIATEAGYDTDARYIDTTPEIMETVAQARLTDAQFLRRWASRLGFEFYVDFDGFHFHERRLGARPVRVFWYYTDPGQGDIIGDPSIENDLTAKPGRVRVRGRDPVERQDIDVEADNDSDPDRRTLAEIVDLIDPESGDTRAVKRIPEQTIAAEDTVPTADETSAAATARARARFRRTQQTAVKMKFSIIGDPLLASKSVVQVRGMGKRLSIRYYLEEVEHDLSTSGYVCNLRMVSDGHGGHSTESLRATGLSLFDDPGAGSSRRASQEILQQMDTAIAAAREAGDTDTVERLTAAQTRYRTGGARARAEVAEAWTQIARSDSPAAEGAASVVASLAQQGGETRSGGRPNQLDGPETADAENDALEPVEYLDPETGATVTRYQQTADRGTSAAETE